MLQAQNPRISVIISAYNDAELIERLLKKIFQTSFSDFEVIVVDDASTDSTPEVVKKFPIRYFRNQENRGVAYTRNRAAREARGEILLSFDSDVLPDFDALSEVDLFFRENPEAVALTGFQGTGKENPHFFAKYKYLRDYAYWYLERDPTSFYYFRPAIGAIKRDVFLQLGGYDDKKYKDPSVEDLEFSYRLARVGKIHFNPKMAVAHPFGSLGKLIRTYFRRTYLFTDILLTNRGFSGVATTSGEAGTIFYAAASLGLFLGGFLIRPLWLVFLPVFAWYIYLQRKFLGLTLGRGGIAFTAGSFLTSWFLYHAIIAGAVWAGVMFVWNAAKRRIP